MFGSITTVVTTTKTCQNMHEVRRFVQLSCCTCSLLPPNHKGALGTRGGIFIGASSGSRRLVGNS